jgi:hypothetical protein
MAEHDVSKAQPEEKSRLRKRTPDPASEKLKATIDTPEPEAIDAHSLEAHAALLSDARLSHPANAVQRARLLSGLQQSYGNAYVQRLLSSRAVQAKLTVSSPDSVYEKEADRVAEAVTRMTNSQVQRQDEDELLQGKAIQRQEVPEEEVAPKAIERQVPEEEEEEPEEELAKKAIQRQEVPEEEELAKKAIQRQEVPEEEELAKKAIQRQEVPEEEELAKKAIHRQEEPEEELAKKAIQRQDEEEPLQGKAIQRQDEEEELAPKAVRRQEMQTKPGIGDDMTVSGDVEKQIQAARGGGQRLPEEIRASVEPVYGHDFSDVRVHADADASRLATQLSAKAFTTGRDVFFREGDYRPDSDDGKKLIAHELTHVVQQSQSTSPGSVERRVEAAEAEASGKPRGNSRHGKGRAGR